MSERAHFSRFSTIISSFHVIFHCFVSLLHNQLIRCLVGLLFEFFLFLFVYNVKEQFHVFFCIYLYIYLYIYYSLYYSTRHCSICDFFFVCVSLLYMNLVFSLCTFDDEEKNKNNNNNNIFSCIYLYKNFYVTIFCLYI